MRCSVSLLNFRKVSIESLGGNGTLAVIVAKIHKFYHKCFHRVYK